MAETANDDSWKERVAKEREWRRTPAGAAFSKFENLLIRYWQFDGQEHISDRRLLEASDAADSARREFLLLIRG